MIGSTVSHYSIIRKIGGGGMGVVYEAEDTRLKIPVAIKFLRADLVNDERAKNRFLHEAHAVATLDHPNVCRFHEINETPGGQLYIVMAFCRGESLEERIARGPVDPRTAFGIAYAVANGLASAHRAGVIHRDIKPGNLMLTDRYVKIVDFGLVKLLSRTRYTDPGATPGTVAYMSPEQLRGDEVGAQTDVWALGVVLYEALTGKHPFEADRVEAIAYRILNDDHKPAREIETSIPQVCSDFVDRCLAKNPAERPSADEALGEMTRIAHDLGWDHLSSMTETGIVPPGRRRRKTVWAAGAAIVVVAVGAWIVWDLTRPPSVYVTDIRAAVLPFTNLVERENDAFVTGITDIASESLAAAARDHASMWVVPYAYVLSSRVVEPAYAGRAMGVNRIVTGVLQRYGDGLRLSLETVDGTSGRRLGGSNVDFRAGEEETLLGGLPRAVALAVGVRAPVAAAPVPVDNAGDYITGRGLMQPVRDGPRTDGALEALGRVIEADTGFVPAWLWAAWACYYKYRATRDDTWITTAHAYLDEVDRAGEPAPEVLAFAGEVRRRIGDVDDAIIDLERVLASDPVNFVAARDLARAYRANDRYDEAESVLERAIALVPDCYVAHRSLGINFYRTREYEKAIEHLENAIVFAPDEGFTLNALGASYHAVGDVSRAGQYWERSFQVWPTCDSCNNIGFLYYGQGNYAKSARYYEFALTYCDSTDDVAWGNLGRVLYWVDGRREDALVALRRALALCNDQLTDGPDDVEVVTRLADYYAMLGDREATERMIAMADDIGNQSADIIYRLGVACETIGERDRALRRLSEAFKRGLTIERVAVNPMLVELRQDSVFVAMTSVSEPATATDR